MTSHQPRCREEPIGILDKRVSYMEIIVNIWSLYGVATSDDAGSYRISLPESFVQVRYRYLQIDVPESGAPQIAKNETRRRYSGNYAELTQR
jgi:hypothetical protein